MTEGNVGIWNAGAGIVMFQGQLTTNENYRNLQEKYMYINV